MKHHEELPAEPKIDFKAIYYAVGVLSFAFIGLILESGVKWILILGVFGLLFTAFFRGVFVSGRKNSA